MTAKFKVQDIANADIYNAQETLVPPLKFTLVKDLNGDNG
jgi:hypothetical protein